MQPEKKDNSRNILLGIILFLLLTCSFLGYKWKQNSDNYESSTSYISSLNDTLRHLKNGVVEIPQVQVTIEAFQNIVNERNDLQKQLLQAKIKSRNVSSLSNIVTGIELEKPIFIRLDIDTSVYEFNCINFSVDSPNYFINGKIFKEKIEFDNINFPDSISFITYTKRHLFNKDEYNASVRHSNNLIKTTGLMNITIKEKKPFWDRRAYFIGAGIVGGFLLFHK